MLRIIGILTGAALAVAFLIIALGVPEFSRAGPGVDTHASEPPQDFTVGDAFAQAGAEPPLPVESEPESEPESGSGPEPGPEPEPAEPETLAKDLDPDLGFGGWQPEPELVSPAGEQDAFAAAATVAVEEYWYAFWSPFRSEIAAKGFVSRLQETTGIDYRVVKVKTGVYEVAFAYTDDADVEDKLARISNATGLDMSGS